VKRQDSEWYRAGFTKEWWKAADDVERFNFLELLDDKQLGDFYCDWRVWAGDHQLYPDGVWTTLLANQGRGAGKTRSAVEYIKDEVKQGLIGRIAIVGQGEADIREVMIDGDSGFLATAHPDWRPKFRPSVGGGRLEWPNGVTGYVYSAEDPESLRGPQFGLAWFDEPMAVPAEKRAKTVANLKFGLRLGRRPRLIYTTTPKPHRWIREEIAKAKKYDDLPVEQRRYILLKGSTFDNRDNLPESFFEGIVEDYEGTNLGRQEIYAEVLGEEEGAIWTSEVLDKQRITEGIPTDPEGRMAFLKAFARGSERVVVGVDPNITSNKATAHAAGIVIACKRGQKRFILEDCSVKGGPAKWSAAAVAAYVDYEADEIVPEVNQGGEMVSMVCQQAAADLGVDVKIHMVRATRGKQRRAEPVGAAYERGMVHHMGGVGTTDKPGPFFKLESQMTSLHDALDPTGEDFDRCDAAVWALTRLGLKKKSVHASSGGGGIHTFEDFVN
jgi:phage terminase large subunit-like protein